MKVEPARIEALNSKINKQIYEAERVKNLLLSDDNIKRSKRTRIVKKLNDIIVNGLMMQDKLLDLVN